MSLLTYDAFVSKYKSNFTDFDGKFGPQCVDLMRRYCVEVLGISGYTLPAAPYAKNIYQRYTTGPHFKKIVNTPNNMPKKGDIIFWGTYLGVTGIAGHVAIVQSAGLYSFTAFSQNYPKGSNCQLRSFSYKGVMGWLEPIKK
jgi:hypothetical protein